MHTVLAVLLGAGVIVGIGGPLLRRMLGKGSDVYESVWRRSGDVAAAPTLASAIQSIVIVGMGASLGREASIKQAGASIAAIFARWPRLTTDDRRLLVACGIGAGMAAAYNVPLGGALFTIEVLLGTVSLELVLPALAASVIATVASWSILPATPIYDVPKYPLTMSLVLWTLVAGPLLGLAGAWFVRLIGFATRHQPQGVGIILWPIGVFAALGAAAIAFPQLLGNGKDVAQLAFVNQVSLGLLLAIPVLKTVAIASCLASGAHGGLFTPTMMVGAALGGLLGTAWEMVMPGCSAGCCALIGACAFLAVTTQGPISSVVLVLEVTQHLDNTVITMLMAVAVATLVGRLVEPRSVYSIRIAQSDGENRSAAAPQPIRN